MKKIKSFIGSLALISLGYCCFQPVYSQISNPSYSGPCGKPQTFTNHGVVIGHGTTNCSATATGSAGQALVSNGASADPTFQNLSGTGTVNSGTINQVSYYAATGAAVSGSPDITDSGTGTLGVGVASATNGKLQLFNSANANSVTMQSGTTSASYTWNLPAAAGTTNQVMVHNAANNSSWSFLGVPSGGTGQVTLSANGVLIGEGTGAINSTGAGTVGQVLTSNGTGVDPTFQNSSSGSGTVNSGTATQMAYYSGTGTAVSGNTSITDTGSVFSVQNRLVQIGTGSGTSAGLTLGYLGTSGFGAIWSTSVTPSSSNYNFATIGSNTIINGVTSTTLDVNTGPILRAQSTGVMITGGVSVSGIPAHNLIVGQTTSLATGVTPGTSGQVLTSNGASADPTFQNATAGLSTPTIVFNSSPQTSTSNTFADITGLSQTVVAAGTYEITASINNITATSGGYGFQFGGTALIASSQFVYGYTISAVYNKPSCAYPCTFTTGATPSSFTIDGIIVVGGGGTITVQLSSPGAVSTSVGALGYLRLIRIN